MSRIEKAEEEFKELVSTIDQAEYTDELLDKRLGKYQGFNIATMAQAVPQLERNIVSLVEAGKVMSETLIEKHEIIEEQNYKIGLMEKELSTGDVNKINNATKIFSDDLRNNKKEETKSNLQKELVAKFNLRSKQLKQLKNH